MIEQCSKDQPSFKVGHTLLGVVVDWSDAQCKGLKVVVGQDLGEKLLHGCEVHWHRSFQRVGEKICKQSNPEKRRIEKQAFHLAAAAITKVKTKDQIYKPFHCLCGKKSLSESITSRANTLQNKVLSSCSQLVLVASLVPGCL